MNALVLLKKISSWDWNYQDTDKPIQYFLIMHRFDHLLNSLTNGKNGCYYIKSICSSDNSAMTNLTEEMYTLGKLGRLAFINPYEDKFSADMFKIGDKILIPEIPYGFEIPDAKIKTQLDHLISYLERQVYSNAIHIVNEMIFYQLKYLGQTETTTTLNRSQSPIKVLEDTNTELLSNICTELTSVSANLKSLSASSENLTKSFETLSKIFQCEQK